MKYLHTLFGAALCAAATHCAAGETFVGVALTSDYLASGYTQTGGDPALQAYLEHDFDSGLYIGGWMSNVDFGTDDRIELDLTAGFRSTVGKLSYDIGYLRYYYDQQGDCCGEAMVKLDYPLTQTITPGITYYNDLHGYARGGPHVTVDLGKGYSLFSEFETDNRTPNNYWAVTVKRAFDDGMSVSVGYHDRNDTDPTIVLTLAFDTTLSALLK